MAREPVLTLTAAGLWCEAGGFHIDPWAPVDRALITHGHSDHARPGHRAYLATPEAAPVIRHRLGPVRIETLPYGTRRRIGRAEVSFHPAGHVPGSAQIRVAVAGEVWVVTGDYKLEDDGLSTPWQPVPCHTLVTECTFGLPVFTWAPQAAVVDEIGAWVAHAAAEGRTPVLGVYALGKAQRLIAALAGLAPLLTHVAVEATTRVLRDQGLPLPPTVPVTADLDLARHRGRLVLAPPSALGSPWLRRFGPVSTGLASGWMRLRGIRRRRGADRGFVISDHADWPGLNAAVRACGPERVLATHGYTDIFARWLATQGYAAEALATRFAGEAAEDEAEAPRAAPEGPA